MDDQPALLAVVIMVDTATKRLSLQWPPQMPPEMVSQLLMQAVKALLPPPSDLMVPDRPKLILPNKG